MSFFTDLICTKSGTAYDKTRLLNLSEEGAPLFARYDLDAVREAVPKESLADRESLACQVLEFAAQIRAEGS